MNTQFKLIIPLLDKNLTKEMVSPEAGFVGAYTNDVNKPALDDHILLMYDFEAKRTPIVASRMCDFAHKLKTKPFLHRIRGHWYQIYALPIRNADVGVYRRLLYPSFSEKSKLRLIDFWGTSDEDINNYILRPTQPQPEFKENYIEEEDYVEEYKKPDD